MKKFLILLVLFVMLLTNASCKLANENPSPKEIYVFAGAGLVKPLDKVKEEFEKKEGVKVYITYAGSGELYAQIKQTKKGDIFMPGGLDTYNKAKEEGLILEGKEFLLHIPMIVVKKGNPLKIQSIKDLTKPNIKVALGDPKGPAIGSLSEKILNKAQILNEVEKNVVVKEATVNKLILDVETGAVDATIAFKENLTSNTEGIPIEQQYLVIETIPIGILKYTNNEAISRKFYDFVLTEGKNIFVSFGYTPKE